MPGPGITPDQLRRYEALLASGMSGREAAKRIDGASEAGLRQKRKAQAQAAPQVGAQPVVTVIDGDDATIITTPTAENIGDLDALIRERGLDPADWVVLSCTLNEWDALASGGDAPTVIRMRQLKVTLKRKLSLELLAPAAHVPKLTGTRRPRRAAGRPRTYVVEGDHQVPYHDERLDAAVTAMVADLQPDLHVFLGDLLDFPTISKHADHPAARATPQECVDAGYALLRRRAEAAPNTPRKKLKGNHDWRIEGEQLVRAERTYALAPATVDGVAQEPGYSLRRLLHLDTIGVELVEDPRGWEHGEVELVPGVGGLVVRHGWLTGANTARRSLEKRGRSLIVGHTHKREHVYLWDPSAGVERQAVTAGTMSLARHERFPHFVACDDWLQGCVVVTHWPDDRFVIEHARWYEGALYWRDRRW